MYKSMAFTIVLALVLAGLLPACTPTTTPQPAPTAPKPANVIGAEGGTLTIPWPQPGDPITQVTLRIPPGAVAQPVAWTVQPASATAASPAWHGLAPVAAAIVGPSNVQLTQPLQLEFQVDSAKLQAFGVVDPTAMIGLLALADGTALPVEVTAAADLLASSPGPKFLPPLPSSIAALLPAVGNMKIFGPHVVPNPADCKPPYASKHPPVLLVHGWQAVEDIQDYFQAFTKSPDATSWGALSPDHGNLLAKQETDPAEVFELRYYTGFTISKSAVTLAKTLAAIRAATGQKTVTIVAHSMGGLVSRTYTTSPDYAGDVQRLITLGTPHAGTTDLLQNAIDNALGSYKGPGKLALELFTSSAEMLSGSTFLKLLNAKLPADLAGPAPDYHMIRGTKDLLVPVKYASMTASLGLEGKEHLNIVDYCELDKYHTSVGFGSGVADITGKDHPAYPLVCRAVGLTSECGGLDAWQTGVCSCRAACAKVELPYTCSPGKGLVTGTETCDLVDNDCNGQTDEVPADQLASDINNCGQCGKSCLAGQTCSKGKCDACVGGAFKSCDDGNVCTTDSCDSATGLCSHSSILGCWVLLYQDEFDAATLNSFWTPQGTSVVQKDGLLKIQENATDTYAQVAANLPNVANLRIEMKHYMHAGNDYYMPGIALSAKGTPSGFALVWKRSSYAPDYCSKADGYDKILVQSSVGCTVSSLKSSSYYGKWVTSCVEYSKSVSLVSYDAGCDGQVDFTATLAVADSVAMNYLVLSGYGWWTGHFHDFDWIKIYIK